MIRRARFTISKDSEQWSCFRDDAADAASTHSVALESSQSRIRVVRRDGHEKTARGLRIEEKILIFEGNAWFERSAFADERAIIFEAAGKMTFAGGFDSSRKIRERCMIDFERDRLETMRRIAKRHFAGVA